MKFPTEAEKCLATWNQNKTDSLVTLAKRYGAFRDDEGFPPKIIVVFDDESTLTITGRGRNHKVEAGLP